MSSFKPETRSSHDLSWLQLQESSVEERYRKCKLMNTIQHIDIYYEDYSSYSVVRRTKHYSTVPIEATTSISFAANTKADVTVNTFNNTSAAGNSIASKLSRCSITTKLFCIHPRRDILWKPYKNRLVSKTV